MTSNFGGEYHRNGWRYSKSDNIWSTGFLPTFGENVGWTLEIKRSNHTHPNRLVRKIIFWPLGGGAPPDFYTH